MWIPPNKDELTLNSSYDVLQQVVFYSFATFNQKLNCLQTNQIIEKFSQMKVLVIGDVMIDSYLWGKVERISPEAPVPVVSITERENRLGGAANVSLNIQALGATPLLFSVIGDDDKGHKLKKLLKKNNLSCDGIFVDQQRKTTVKSRIISRGQHIARVDEETTEYISSELENLLIGAILNEINTKKIDVIIFVDYDKGVLTPQLFRNINDIARQKGIPTAVDPKKRNFNIYRNVSLFKPNFGEFSDGLSLPLKKGDMKALKEATETYRKKQNHLLIFITLSELGVYINDGKQEKHFPAVIRYIADVSGAGDTVISVASLALAAGLEIETMALMSNIAGGLVCEKPGVVSIDKEQLIKEMNFKKNYHYL